MAGCPGATEVNCKLRDGSEAVKTVFDLSVKDLPSIKSDYSLLASKHFLGKRSLLLSRGRLRIMVSSTVVMSTDLVKL